jgi:hypothetical protein
MHLKRILLATALVAGMLGIAAPAGASDDGVDEIIKTVMKGKHEFPGPGDPNGKGEFAAVLSGDTMCYSFYAKKIGSAAASHIHDAVAGASGPVIITLILPTQSGVSECKTAVPDADDTNVTMSVSELAALKANPSDFYVNVHTSAFPAGAIRGQL